MLYLCVCLRRCWPVSLYVCLFVCLPVNLSVSLSVCVPVCLLFFVISFSMLHVCHIIRNTSMLVVPYVLCKLLLPLCRLYHSASLPLSFCLSASPSLSTYFLFLCPSASLCLSASLSLSLSLF